MMTVLDRAILMLCITFAVVVTGFTLAAIFESAFRANGTTVVTAILGAMTMMISILVGSYFARDLRKSVDEESREAVGTKKEAKEDTHV